MMTKMTIKIVMDMMIMKQKDPFAPTQFRIGSKINPNKPIKMTIEMNHLIPVGILPALKGLESMRSKA